MASARPLPPVALLLLVACGLNGVEAMLRGKPPPVSPACMCLNWKAVYEERRVKCGMQGRELRFLQDGGAGAGETGSKLERGQDEIRGQYCDSFFQRLNGSQCVNFGHNNDVGFKQNGQWCYVSSECSDWAASPVADVPSLSWKMCAGGDEQLGDNPIDGIAEIARNSDLDVGLVLKMAYPMWGDRDGPKITWPHVQSVWGRGSASDLASMDRDVRWGMRWLVSRNKPMVFRAGENDAKALGVVVGEKAYEVRTVKYEPSVPDSVGQAFALKHPNARSELVCVSGCHLRG